MALRLGTTAALALALSACQSLSAKEACVHDDNTFRCVKYVSNYDGDTIRFNIPGVHPLIGQKIRVRLIGVDTAEMNAQHSCEIDAAIAAQKFVEKTLSSAKRIDLVGVKRGNYFRIVAEVVADGKPLSSELLSRKLAVRYRKKKKRRINWCPKEG